MSGDEGFARVAIGISFGNSNSSIARVDSVSPIRSYNIGLILTVVQDGKTEVIANEEGGMSRPRA